MLKYFMFILCDDPMVECSMYWEMSCCQIINMHQYALFIYYFIYRVVSETYESPSFIFLLNVKIPFLGPFLPVIPEPFSLSIYSVFTAVFLVYMYIFIPVLLIDSKMNNWPLKGTINSTPTKFIQISAIE